ncbi:UDP-N-acetylmuramoyl-L-alanine--D-glutamate ligase [Pseudorhodoferax sp. Leaf267]|uniref:UDP-N-acetylmuramoyl-L-alanine--D-glutamate ligase n=1 Tax=Pseudorhodoferax sp. Leaf267 TaxID=1736316 RepID=UPI0006F4D1C8|nr:UDP-N-acetylmuramoyl-L-alanine--D-glutamate ligase [Pseudorhodoferax sp. Leaf267]KQP14135.1 UDP-N-acetylmuramoylalanine--D-glutamate ligase [Pseudorhodoferax sp. Leaf267]
MKHLQDLSVLILGLGASGLAMARWCAAHGARVTVADTREAPPQLETLRAELPGVRFVAGPLGAALVEGQDVRAVYRSPGLSPAQLAPVLDAARAIGLFVGGELDLFAQALKDLREADSLPLPEGERRGEGEAADEEAPVLDDAPLALTPTQGERAQEEEAPPALAQGVPGQDEEAVAVVAPQDDEDAAAIVVVPPPIDTGYRPAVLAITGTNGKTTVTSLTGQLVERAGKSVAVAGNIGPTLLDTLAEHIAADTLPEVWVLELSSFQLDAATQFEPTAATVLNLSQDHLDWHGSMAAYAAAKARIFGATTLMLLNRDDSAVMDLLPKPVAVKGSRAKPVPRAYVGFGGDMPQRPGDYGLEVVNGMAWLVRAGESDGLKRRRNEAAEELHLQRLMPADALRIRGRHNAVNALAALALAQAAGCALAPMLYGLREYRGEPHRVEPIATVHDVEYFDDSKGTNVGATVAALSGLGADRRVVVILGGEGKGQDFAPLAPAVAQYARAVVLIGRDAPLIRTALADTGVTLADAASMTDAVRVATERAQPGDAVLMSPACASFDMFRNYEHRAAVFQAAVRALAEEHGGMLETSP